MSAIKKMLEFTKGKHWWALSHDDMYWSDSIFYFRHQPRYYRNGFKKAKYYRRKKYFVPYESHRKRGVEYLPF